MAKQLPEGRTVDKSAFLTGGWSAQMRRLTVDDGTELALWSFVKPFFRRHAPGLLAREAEILTLLAGQEGVPAAELDTAGAQAELLRRWLAACGPATEADLKWWTGWRVTEVRRALAAIGAEPVSLDEGTGYVAEGDTGPVPAPEEPWAALLPGLDPTAMGWQQRDWYLAPELRPLLFDGSGNVGPTVWWDGRVVGGWAQRPDGEITWRILAGEGVGREALAAIEAEAERLSGWVGATRITPRFRTPLEKELTAG